MSIVSRSLSGAYPKENMMIDGEDCILKYPLKEENIIYPLHVSEYISCELFKQMGYPVQDTSLVTLYGKETVKIKKFKEQICPVLSMGEYTLETYDIPGKSLNNNTIEILELALKEEENKLDRIFEIIVIDSLILNTDRHLGNIALYENGLLAPLYDNGLSLGVVEYFSGKITDTNKVIEKYKMQFRYKTKRMTWNVFEKRYDNLISSVSNKTIDNLKNSIRKTNIETITIKIPLEIRKRWIKYIEWIEILYNKSREIVLERLDKLSEKGGLIKWI